MARIELVDVGHAYGGAANAGTETRWALRPMTMTWRDGGAYALLGPSGCGKTTLLNLISGLLTPTQGRILFDGKDITQLGPRERNIAQVFQFPVLYDTMTVFDNLAFPLRNRGWKEAAVRTRVSEVAELLDLAGDLKRRARGLPPDAQQKISLGRGLVRTDVAAVLLDEPLTVIDPHLKWLLRRKLKQIHQQLKVSLIYVTHDQVEALTFAEEVVVMNHGEVLQVGTPQALYEAPEHTFVGHFIGSPGMNFLPCQLGANEVRMGDVALPMDADWLARAAAAGSEHHLGFRPDSAEVLAAPVDSAAGAAWQPARVQAFQPMGTHSLLQLSFGGGSVWVRAAAAFQPAGDHVWLRPLPAKLALFADQRLVPRNAGEMLAVANSDPAGTSASGAAP
jgi:glycerol transport system ATP-binding protein